MSISETAFPLGQIVIPQLAVVLMLSYGWRISNLILGLLAFGILPLGLALPKSVLKRGQQLESDSKLSTRARVLSNQQKKESLVRRAIKTFLQVFRNRSLLLALVIYFICGFTDVPISIHLVPFLSDAGFSRVFAANALGLIGVGSVLATIVAGSVSQRIGTRRFLLGVYSVRVISLILLMIGNQEVTVILFSLLFGASFYSMSPVICLWIGDVFRPSSFGVIFGTILLSHSVAAALGTYVDGLIFVTYGNYLLAFAMTVVLALFASLLSLFIKEK
jgi:predicted MFS family arabinose efflux permease